MSKHRKLVPKSQAALTVPGYDQVLGDVVGLLESARRAAARSVNSVITVTYWEIGRRIVEFEQGGDIRSIYGAKVIERLSADLTAKFGRGFSKRNLEQMRLFYSQWSIAQTTSAQSSSSTLRTLLSLPWSHYVLLLKVDTPEARQFYEAEARRNGWTVRQLERQITTLFYERTLASRKKGAILRKGAILNPGEAVSPEEEIKDPFVLEFLGLKDEYSESDLEEALVRELEALLLELGGDFTLG